MTFAGINLLAVLAATVAGFAAGSVWYMVFGKTWAAAQGKVQADFKPSPGPFILAFAGQFVMAFVLAGLLGHLGSVNIHNGIISAIFVWIGFIAPTVAINDSFQGAKVSLTVIDAGHWLIVLMLMGAVLGAFGV